VIGQKEDSIFWKFIQIFGALNNSFIIKTQTAIGQKTHNDHNNALENDRVAERVSFAYTQRIHKLK
jgi:hypothetical protein